MGSVGQLRRYRTCVRDIHCLSIGGNSDAIWLLKGIFDDIDSTSGRPKAVSRQHELSYSIGEGIALGIFFTANYPCHHSAFVKSTDSANHPQKKSSKG